LRQTKTDSRCLGIYATKAPRPRLHLIADINCKGMLFFACEQAPLLTFQSYGLPSRCPVCGVLNPFRGETNANKQG